MADNSVNHFFKLINQHIDYQEDLNNCLSQAEALAEVALGHDFYECSDEAKHHYFGALSDIISKAKIINQQAINHWFEIKSTLEIC